MKTVVISPLPEVTPLDGSPELVKVLDRIRFGPLEERDDLGEFLWFIREYPRVYRHHYDHAEYRLQSIVQNYSACHAEALATFSTEGEDFGGERLVMSRKGYSRYDTYAVYWDFESYLVAISSALDAAARIVGTAYRVDTPANFNRFCRTAPESNLKKIFVRAQQRWVRRAKAYRDCFTHFTPVDTLLFMGIHNYDGVIQVRAKLPVNPEVREILAFRYSRRVEVLTYAAVVWRHLRAFDRAVAREVWKLYRRGEYPVKTENLFFFGRRHGLNVVSETR